MNRKTMIGISLAATTLIAVSTAHASMRQEQDDYYAGGAPSHIDFTYTVSAAGKKTESLTLMNNQRFHFIRIERIDTLKQWELEPEKKIYSESAMVTEQAYRQTKESLRKNDGLVIAEPEPLEKIHPQVEGPGAPVVISGFTCRPYVLKRIKTFISPQNPKQTLIETELEKIWVTGPTPALARYRQDERTFDKAVSDKLWGGKDFHEVIGGDPLREWWDAQGHDNEFVIRWVILYYRDIAGQKAPAGKSDAQSPASAPPAWALEADPSFAGHLARGKTAHQRTMTKINVKEAPAEAFEIPAGYKRIVGP